MKDFSIPYNGLEYPVKEVDGNFYFTHSGNVFHFHGGRYLLYLEPKFILFKGKVTRLDYGSDGMWRDALGTIYGLTDQNSFYDPDPRCGVYPFELPLDSPLTEACRIHDREFSTLIWQMYHTEEEANEELRRNLVLAGARSFTANLMKFICDQVGGFFWDNKKTRLK